MRVEQTSATTFELQSDNGCMALAGFATETMGRPGVYFVRKDAGITREQAVEAFHADARVKKLIAEQA